MRTDIEVRWDRVANALRRADYMNWSAAELAEKIDGTIAAIEAGARAAVLRELREEVAGMACTPWYSGPESDEMCPNCVTPWKCNGPHLITPHEPDGADVNRAAVLAAIDRRLSE